MGKAYNITSIKFEDNLLVLIVDNQLIKLNLNEISTKLAKATEIEKNNFQLSPSGYGIHWSLLDEDLSINGLLVKTNNSLLGGV